MAELENGTKSPRQLMEWLIHSAEWSHSAPMTEFGPSLHYGRGVFIRSLPGRAGSSTSAAWRSASPTVRWS